MSDCFWYDQAYLMEKIQEKREEMIRLGSLMGLDAKETIQCSQELDQLLNRYQYFYDKTQTNTIKRYRSGKKWQSVFEKRHFLLVWPVWSDTMNS